MKVLPLLVMAAFTITAAAQSAAGNAASDVTAPHNTQVTNDAAAAASRSGASEATNTAARSGRLAASSAQASDVSAKLTKSINSKNARVGDAVEAKTTHSAMLADGTKLPKGTRLLGHVTQVQRESHAQKTSELAFSFDRAVLHNGREVPIHAVLRSLSAPPSLNSDSAFDGDANAGDGMMAANGGGGGLLGAGRGAVGGGSALAGGALRSGGNVAGGAVNRVGSTTASADAAATGEMGAMANTGQRNIGGALQTSANSTTQGEVIPVGNMRGVSFYNTSGADSAAMLQGTGRNIDLYSGSQMTLGVTASH